MIRLLVGLGNPGRRYRLTRHNVGFMVIEEIGRRYGASERCEAPHALVERVELEGGPIVLARPTLFMNRSGPAVRALLDRERLDPDQALVICDDLAIPFGALRVRRQGSHGGHNGLRSIIEALGTTVEVRHVPGHCPGNVLFYLAALGARGIEQRWSAENAGEHDPRDRVEVSARALEPANHVRQGGAVDHARDERDGNGQGDREERAAADGTGLDQEHRDPLSNRLAMAPERATRARSRPVPADVGVSEIISRKAA